MTATQTAGQAFTAEIRTMYRIGPRTRWYRKASTRRGRSFTIPLTREQIIERLFTSLNYRGYDDERRTAIFSPAHAALCAWTKHVDGYRIDPTLRMAITTDASPWAFTAYLGRMVDSGLTNSGEFEEWFRAQAHELRTQVA